MASPARDRIEHIYGDKFKDIETKHLNYVDKISNEGKTLSEHKADLASYMAKRNTLPKEESKLPNMHSLFLYLEQALHSYLGETNLSKKLKEPLSTALNLVKNKHKSYTVALNYTATKLTPQVERWLAEVNESNPSEEPEKTLEFLAALMPVLWIARTRVEFEFGYKSEALKIDNLINRLEELEVKISEEAKNVTASEPEPTQEISFSDATEALQSLIEIKEKEEKIKADLECAKTVLQAYDDNEKKTTDRLYAHDLIEQQKENIGKLLTSASEEEQENWANIQKDLNEASALGTAASTASWLGSTAIRAYRNIAPEQLQDLGRQNTFTPDGRAKRAIQSLAQNVKDKSEQSLIKIEQDKKALFKKLPPDKDGKELSECSTDELKDLLTQCQDETKLLSSVQDQIEKNVDGTRNSSFKGMVEAFKKFCQKYLNPIHFFNAGNKGREQTIAETKSWGKTFGDFFAKISEKFASLKQSMQGLSQEEKPKPKADPDDTAPDSNDSPQL